MGSSDANIKLLKHEDQTGFYRKITVRTVKIRNQFRSDFHYLIQKYDTPASICGYVATSVSKYCAENLSGMMCPEQIDKVLDPLVNSKRTIKSLVKESMKSIQNDRKNYLNAYSSNFKTKKEKKEYMRDWVANFEISDLFRNTPMTFDNLYFARHCAMTYPTLAEKCQHEQKRRLFEELPFAENKTFLESFNPRRELFSEDEFVAKDRSSLNFNDDKPMVFVGDLMGHYITLVALKIKLENGDIQDTVLLLDSTDEKDLANYNTAVILKMVCRAAFADSIDMTLKSPM